MNRRTFALAFCVVTNSAVAQERTNGGPGAFEGSYQMTRILRIAESDGGLRELRATERYRITGTDGADFVLQTTGESGVCSLRGVRLGALLFVLQGGQVCARGWPAARTNAVLLRSRGEMHGGLLRVLLEWRVTTGQSTVVFREETEGRWQPLSQDSPVSRSRR